MACKQMLVVTLSMIVASPVLASQPEPAAQIAAPDAPAGSRYCLRVDPITGSRIETIQCRTREDWDGLGVDVDQEWAENGVRVLGPAPMSGWTA